MTQAAWVFLRQFARSPRSVGAVLPSSAALAEVMLAPVDFRRVRTIVEFGPGTGAFTRAIASRLQPQTRYLGIELNQAFCQALAAAFPQLVFVHGSVADLTKILTEHGIAQIDAIICGLPWASLPVALQDQVFGEIDRALAPGGVFVTFAYLHGLALPGARALRRRLRQSFSQVSHSPVVWGNAPPAFAYICRKAAI
jgi:phosphatidylethanolamine/phosphatidyl-N-methylethanolamine N-methyltransferase